MMNVARKIDHSSQPVLVVGLGLTGWSVVRFLESQGVQVVVTDTRERPPYLEHLENTYPHIPFIQNLQQVKYENYGEVVASPGVGVQADSVIGDIELFVRIAKAPIIAITGSNGKSTVTMLVTEMISAGASTVEVGGNIGTPALDLLQRPVPEFYVLELSSFQLETTYSLRAAASVVLNVSEDHMDRYDSLAEYADSKFRIHENALHPVINRDDETNRCFTLDQSTLSFGLDEPDGAQLGIVNEDGQRFFAIGPNKLAPVSNMALQGEQNVSNMLAAMALVQAAGIALNTKMIDAVLNYPGLPHRCELVGTWNQVKWINDSKGTNVGATLAAISGSDKPLILIAGGQGKGADFRPMAEALHDGIKQIILFGEDAPIIAGTLGVNQYVQIVDSLDQAVSVAKSLSVSGDTVLFSPACASFDMFDSYVHRGEVFMALVQEVMLGE